MFSDRQLATCWTRSFIPAVRRAGAGGARGRDSLARLAWVEALIPGEDGTTYRGMGGELVLQEEPTGGLLGSFLVAFERAPEALAQGPARLVIGDAFAAPRNRLPLRAALP